MFSFAPIGMARRSSTVQYVNLRVPRPEYEKLKLVREQLRRNPDYSWVESLALGAMIGLLATHMLKQIASESR